MKITPLQPGDRARFNDGQTGTIDRLINGGIAVYFVSDTGAQFTARSDEVSAIDADPLPAPKPLALGECRTILRFVPGRRRQATPYQLAQANAGAAAKPAVTRNHFMLKPGVAGRDHWAAGADVGLWQHRIQCWGETPEEASALRDRVVVALNAHDGFVAALERILALNGSTGGPAALVAEYKHIALTALALAKLEG